MFISYPVVFRYQIVIKKKSFDVSLGFAFAMYPFEL